MLELALHILDIVENSVRAGATLVRILIRENRAKDLFLMRITDNGSGMTPEERQRALDPFYTTKKVRRVGLGLPMLSDAADRTGGRMTLRSKPETGTVVEAAFGLSHIDRQPMGNIASTLITIIVGNPGIDLYIPARGGRQDLPAGHEGIKKSTGGCAPESPRGHRLSP